MADKKKKEDIAQAQAAEYYGVTAFQLVELMSLRTPTERENALTEYEGVEGLMTKLEVNLKTGLEQDPVELERRRRAFGANVIPDVPPKSFLALCVDAIQDKTLIILMVAAVASIILAVTVEPNKEIAWVDGAAILAAVVIVVLVTALNDWTKEKQFRGLQKKLESDSKFSVLRGGDTIEVTHAELVVGDIAEFKYGNTFPVDGILVQGNDVKVSEAALTGEAELVKKKELSSAFLFSGTQVMEGRGTMLVTAVGQNSQQGRIFALMRGIEVESGFITAALKKLYARLASCCGCAKQPDPESPEEEEEPDEKPPQVEVHEYDPSSAPNPDLEEEEEEDEDESEEASLLGCMGRVNKKRRKGSKQKEEEKEEEEGSGGSVLQKKLNKLAVQIGYAGTVAAIICVVVLSVRFAIEEFAIHHRSWDSSRDFSELLHFVIIGITVLVVAVPEGLPLAVTIALAFSVKKMLKDNNLVRHLHACETMGNATSICSDKTGTLTTNRMTVVESYFAGTHYDVIPDPVDLPSNLLELLKLNIAVNSNYTSLLIDPSEEKKRKDSLSKPTLKERVVRWLPWRKEDASDILGQGLKLQVGNVTECALLGLLEEFGINYSGIREAHPTSSLSKVFTFNSNRKSMTTILPRPEGGHLLLCKGASEIVLKKCTHIIGENGRVIPLSNEDRKGIVSTVVQPMAHNALRTLCMAYRVIPIPSDDSEISQQMPDLDNEEEMVANLTCIGIVGIQDPVRPEVPRCIQQCQDSGIIVRMVTGDNVDTARAIAMKCGIISTDDRIREKDKVMDGKEFNRRIRERGEVNQQLFDRVWPRLRVLARSSPQDKHVLVDHIIRSKLNKNREVVAVTGDGTNDGPALKRADVGFAMGIAGTDVAKEACDIILTDDNFASIVKAVMWGRNVYDSISKFLQFQLTVNIVAVTLTIISAFTITDSPLRAIQMLWVNLIMDTFASLALATENPTDDLLKRKPYGRTKSLISRHMWLYMLGHSTYQLGVLFVLVFAGHTLFDIENGAGRGLRADPTEHFTVVFNTFVFMQIFNELNARKIHGERNVLSGIHTNWIFLTVMIGQTTVQILIVEFGSIVFHTTGLSVDLWLWCIFLGSTELVVGQLLLFIPISKLPLHRLKFWKSKEEVDTFEEPYDPLDEEGNRAQLMWMKSLRRIQTQIRVVNAFRSSLESGHLLHVSKLPNLQETPRPGRYQGGTIEGRVTSV